MHSATLFYALLGATSLASASPVRIEKRSFKVERVRNERFNGYNGPRELLKTYRKFNLPIPPGLVEAIGLQDGQGQQSGQTTRPTEPARENLDQGQRQDKAERRNTQVDTPTPTNETKPISTPVQGNQSLSANQTTPAQGTGVVEAVPERNDVEYLSPITIGGQTLNVAFDSGSSDLWVFTTALSSRAAAGHTIYDPNQSDTFALMDGATFLITYGDGSGAAGLVGTDTVDVGGVTVTGQAVELATAVSEEFVDDTNNNGLMGLAFSDLNTVQPRSQKTFFDNVAPDLAEPVFTADLRSGEPGAYEFGRIDDTKFTGDMAWIPVNTTQGFWQFSSETFAVGDNGNVQMGTPGGQAIADTGTTLILASPTTVEGYYARVQGAQFSQQAGGFVVPCDGDMPDLMLDIGGVYMAKVKGDGIAFAPLQGNNCFGGLQASPSLQVYGDIFFKSQFVAFNNGNNSLGMAEHV